MFALLDAALEYAAQGIAVFPCQPRDKAPLRGSGGFLDATVSTGMIRGWLAQNPDRNIAAPCDKIFVLDCDSEAGYEYAKSKGLPDTYTVTRSHNPEYDNAADQNPKHKNYHEFSRHYYFKMPKVPIERSQDIFKEKDIENGRVIDFLGTGGYVLLAPSIHYNGLLYTADRPFVYDELAEVPEWIIKLVKNPPKKPSAPESLVDEGGFDWANGTQGPRPKPDDAQPEAQIDAGMESCGAWLDEATQASLDPRPVNRTVLMECLKVAAVKKMFSGYREWIALGSALYRERFTLANWQVVSWPGTPCGEKWNTFAKEPSRSNPAKMGLLVYAARMACPGVNVYADAATATVARNEKPLPEMLKQISTAQDELAALSVILQDHEPTDSSLAEIMADSLNDRVCFIPELNSWHFYNGKKWVRDDSRYIVQGIKTIVRSLQVNAEKEGESKRRKEWMRFEAYPRIEAVAKIAATEPKLIRHLEDFDADPWSVNCQNGLLNLKTGELKPHHHTHNCLKVLGVAYDPEATSQRFWHFLLAIANERENLAQYIQARLGYALTGDMSMQDFLIHYGAGANGKSVLQNLCLWIWGDYAAAPASSFIMESRTDGERPSPELLATKGKRLLFVSESESGQKLNTARVKSLSGQDKQSARALFSNLNVEWDPMAKIVLSTNHAPGIRNVDYALRRRVKMVPFDRRFEGTDKDPQILDKLRNEAPGILTEIVKAARVYAETHSLPECQDVETASLDFMDSEDIIERWLTECTVPLSEGREAASTCFKNYTEWCQRDNIRPASHNAFGRALTEKGHPSSKPGGMAIREGFRLKGEAE